MNRKYVFLFLFIVILIVAVAGCTTNDTNDANNNDTTDNGLAPNNTNNDDTNDSDTNGSGTEGGEEIMNDKCTQCHGIGRIESQSKNESEWRTTINSMIQKGAYLNDDEINTLSSYLAENYGEK